MGIPCRLISGAPLGDGNGNDSGYIRIYEWNGVSYDLMGSSIDGAAAGDEFGTSVAVSGDGLRIAVGAPHNAGNGADAGHVQIYELSGTTWSQLGSDIEGETAGDLSGSSVSMNHDGSRVSIGSIGITTGRVRVYELSGTTWSKMGSDIDGDVSGDEFGTSVSLSSDGSRIGIGAAKNNGSTGSTSVYEWTGVFWTQVSINLDGDGLADLSGNSVSLSSDGTQIAIGSPENDFFVSNVNSGSVAVFEIRSRW
jgi:hypothetical protein